MFLVDSVNTVKLLYQFLNNKCNNILSPYTCKLMYICLYLHSYYVNQFVILKFVLCLCSYVSCKALSKKKSFKVSKVSKSIHTYVYLNSIHADQPRNSTDSAVICNEKGHLNSFRDNRGTSGLIHHFNNGLFVRPNPIVYSLEESHKE